MIRPEATGFGCVYFAKEMLATKGESFEGKRVAVSGFGNVAWGAALKVTELGGKVVTLSGPDGYIYDPDRGDRRGKIPKGTRFEDLPENWRCPACGAGKKMFKPLGGPGSVKEEQK